MTKEKIVIILKYDVLYYNLEAKIWKALVETGSKMDDVVFEGFKGTGNMELVLDKEQKAWKELFWYLQVKKKT